MKRSITAVKNDSFLITKGEEPQTTVRFSLSIEGKTPTVLASTLKEGTMSLTFQDGTTLLAELSEKHGTFVLTECWKAGQEGGYRLHTSFTLDGDEDNTIFVPAVWYKNNLAGVGCFPSLPRSASWSFLETRSSIPCAIALLQKEQVLNINTKAATEAAKLTSVSWDRHAAIFTTPGSEWPASYHGKQALEDTKDKPKPRLHLNKGETYETSFFFTLAHTNDVLEAWESHLRHAAPLFPHQQPPTISWNTYATTKLTHLLSLVEKESDGGAYLMMGKGNGKYQEVYNFTSASFLVKAVEAASAFARTRTYDKTNPHLQREIDRLAHLFSLPIDEHFLTNLSIKLGRYYLQAERQEGIFQDCHDLKSGVWGGYLGIGEHPEFKLMVNSRCNGEAMEAYLELYQTLKRQGIDIPEFLELPKRVARFYCDSQLSGGSFGRWWTTTGKPENAQGTNGAYIATFFCTLCSILPKNDPLYGDIRSALYRACTFYATVIEEGKFYGDTLDADSCDKEAGVALLSLFLHAYTLFQDDRYLALAKKAASFVLSWIWQEDSFIPQDSPLGTRHFHTQGMTSVSVAHHHLDFYGMNIAVDLHHLSEATDDPFYQSQAVLLMNACRQLIATDDDLLGRDDAFWGWQPEQINHTDWDYFDQEDNMRGHYSIDIAWVNVLGYDAYLTLDAEGALS